MDAPRQFGFVLFGAGRIGSVHMSNLLTNQRARLLYLVEEESRAMALVRQHRLEAQVKVLPSCEADTALQDTRVDAVMICTPSFTHEQFVRTALQAGKAVFCEKPLAPTVEATESCYDLAEKVGKPLFCAFNRHWDPQVRRMREMVRGGELGQLRVIKSVSRDPPGMATEEYIRTSGGIFIDSAVHDLDLLCWITGERPQSVYATGHASLPMYQACGDVDSCQIVLKFPSGVLGTVEVSREAPLGYFQYVEVFGSGGMVQKDQLRNLQLQHWSLEGTRQEPLVDLLGHYGPCYSAELQHFLDVLDGKASVEVTREDVVGANRLAVLCKESLDTGMAINL